MRITRSIPVLILMVVLAAVGCRDERIVLVERNVLGDPLPAGAGEFVGYSRVAARMTVCGECHVSQQNQWIHTAHADAFATLEAIPSAQAFCQDCHAVSEQGNDVPAATQAGWTATQHPRYHDVQCESCHGPGLEHVTTPDGGTSAQMMARVDAGPDMEGTCAECHSGYHHPFVEEWAASGHGSVLASPAGRAECQSCHTGQGALEAFGVDADYVEKGSGEHLAITCAVCHDPHAAGNEGQLRFSISVPDEEKNLCMKCHHKRGGPEPTGNRGPHSPQGPLLLGDAGWWPPNLPIEPGDRIVGTHGSEANPRLCAGCHVQSYEVENETTGAFQFATTGHLFEAIPCVDANGQPVAGECALGARSFRSCTEGGCHGSENAARSALTVVRQRLDNLNAQLLAQLAQVPASETSPNDGRYSVAEGAKFNSQLAAIPGTAVHNPFLMEALLIATIQEVQRTYGVAALTGSAELSARLRQVLTATKGAHGAER